MSEPTTPAPTARKSIDWGIVLFLGLLLTFIVLGAWFVDQYAHRPGSGGGTATEERAPSDREIRRLEAEIREADQELGRLRTQARLDSQPEMRAQWRELIETRETELRAMRAQLDELREMR